MKLDADPTSYSKNFTKKCTKTFNKQSFKNDLIHFCAAYNASAKYCLKIINQEHTSIQGLFLV